MLFFIFTFKIDVAENKNANQYKSTCGCNKNFPD